MPDMWRHRKPPVPLDYDKIMDGSFELHAQKASINATAENGHVTNGRSNNVANVNGKPSTDGQTTGSATAKLKDQRALSLKDNLELFIARCVSSASTPITLLNS